MRYRLITFLIFGAVLVGIGEWDSKNHRFRSLNNWWLEFCAGNARDQLSDPEVTFIRIDKNYVPVFGEELSRADYAAMLGFVAGFEPVSVAFEPALKFDEKVLVNQDALVPLKEAALKLPELTLGSVAENGQSPEKPVENVKYPPLSNVKGDTAGLTPLTRTIALPDPQLLANGTSAFTRIELDANGEGDHLSIPLIARQGEAIVPGFVVQSLTRHAGLEMDAVAVDLESAEPAIRIGEKWTIPVDRKGRMKIYEHSGVRRQKEDLLENQKDSPASIEDADRKGRFKTLRAIDLALTGSTDPEMKKLLASTDLQDEFDSLKSNIVVIGNDYTEGRHVKFSNGEPAVAQAELLTRAIATIQSGRFIEWWPDWGRYLAVGVIAILALFMFRFSRRRVVGLSILAALLYFFVVVAIFKATLTWAPPFAPLTLFALLIVIGVILPDPKKAAKVKSDPAESAEN